MQRKQITCHLPEYRATPSIPPSVFRKINCTVPHFSGDELGETSFPVFR
jgi:hypothetical protein